MNNQLFKKLSQKFSKGEIIFQTPANKENQDFILIDKSGQQLKLGSWKVELEHGCLMVKPIKYDPKWNYDF